MYLGKEQGAQDFDSVIEEVITLATTEHEYKTLVIDSLTKLLNVEYNREYQKLTEAKKSTEYSAERKPGQKKLDRLLGWIERLDMNVILICHEKDEYQGGQSTGNVTADCPIKVEHDLHLSINVKAAGANRKGFVLKSRLEGFPKGSSFDFTFDEFAARFGQDTITRKSEVFVPATTEQVSRLVQLLNVQPWESEEARKKAETKMKNQANAEEWTDVGADMMASWIVALENKIKQLSAL